MNKLFFFTIMVMFSAGCALETTIVEKQHIPVKEQDITFIDVQVATEKCIEDLIIRDALKKSDGSKPFVMVDHFRNSLLPNVRTDSLAQDVRFKILISDKAVTMPAPEEKKDADSKKEAQDKLPAFDFFLTGGITKTSASDENGPVGCFAVTYQLKEIKTGSVVWQCEEKLVCEPN